MQEGHREAASPLPRLFVWQIFCWSWMNEQNATVWHKVSLFPQLPNKTRGGTIKERGGETGSSGGNERVEMKERWRGGGVFISPDLMGRVSLCMSQTQRESRAEFHWVHTHTHTHTHSNTYTISIPAWGWFSVAVSVHFRLPKVLSCPGFTAVRAHYADDTLPHLNRGGTFLTVAGKSFGAQVWSVQPLIVFPRLSLV